MSIEEKQAKALALLKANPSIAARELERRKQNRKRKANGEPMVPLTEELLPLVVLGKADLIRFLDA